MSEIKKAALIIAQDMFRDRELFGFQKALETAHAKTQFGDTIAQALAE